MNVSAGNDPGDCPGRYIDDRPESMLVQVVEICKTAAWGSIEISLLKKPKMASKQRKPPILISSVHRNAIVLLSDAISDQYRISTGLSFQ
jgi:hypothetical protein